MKTTWNGDPDLKCAVVTSLIQHREADEFKRGTYAAMGRSFYGCALGCTLIPFGANKDTLLHLDTWVDEAFTRVDHREWAAAVAQKYSLPEWLTRLEEAVFESVPERHADWPIDLTAAIPVGVPFRELKVRVFDELKRRIKARGVRPFARLAAGDEDYWHDRPRSEWEAVKTDLLELLRGVALSVPAPVNACPALDLIAA